MDRPVCSTLRSNWRLREPETLRQVGGAVGRWAQQPTTTAPFLPKSGPGGPAGPAPRR